MHVQAVVNAGIMWHFCTSEKPRREKDKEQEEKKRQEEEEAVSSIQ